MNEDELLKDLADGLKKEGGKIVMNFTKYKIDTQKKYSLNELLKVIYGEDLDTEYLIFSDEPKVAIEWKSDSIDDLSLMLILQAVLSEYEYLLFKFAKEKIFVDIIEPNLSKNDKRIISIDIDQKED